MEPLAVDQRTAAKLLGVCDKTLRAMTRDKAIPCKQAGRRLVYSVDALRAWLRSNPCEAAS